jgi:hypothetical protein
VSSRAFSLETFGSVGFRLNRSFPWENLNDHSTRKGGLSLPDKKAPLSPRQLQQIQALAEHLTYGTISLIFQNGTLVQIDKTEKIRTDKETG